MQKERGLTKKSIPKNYYLKEETAVRASTIGEAIEVREEIPW